MERSVTLIPGADRLALTDALTTFFRKAEHLVAEGREKSSALEFALDQMSLDEAVDESIVFRLAVILELPTVAGDAMLEEGTLVLDKQVGVVFPPELIEAVSECELRVWESGQGDVKLDYDQQAIRKAAVEIAQQQVEQQGLSH